MKSPMAAAAALAIVLVLPAEGQAQLREISRSTYTFGKGNLTIDVQTETPGSLRVIRGRRGEIRASARAPDGFADFGLTDRRGNTLRLTAIASDRVDFIVVVPENVRVRVRLPDRPVSEVFATTQPLATYSWDPTELPGTVPPASGLSGEPRPESRTAVPVPAAGGMHVAISSNAAPRNFIVSDNTELRRLTVRWEGSQFQVATSRRLALRSGASETIEVRAPGEPLDMVVTVPAGTREFELRVGSATALVLRDGDAAVLCTPVIDQEFDNGRRSFTFTPQDGRLECESRLPPGVRRT